MEARRAQAEAMAHVPGVAQKVAADFEKIFGRHYDLIESYRMEDAEYAVVIMGSAAGTMKEYADRLREKGEKVGVIKVRMFRPFPAKEIAEALKNVKAVAILDRAESFNNVGGPLSGEVTRALFYEKVPCEAMAYMYGLGGRDFLYEHAEKVLDDLKTILKEGRPEEFYRYLGVRE